MSGNHSTTDSDTLGAGTATPPGRDKFDAWFDAKTAPELAAAMAETRQLRELVREICDTLVSQKYPAAKVAPWLKRAGLPA